VGKKARSSALEPKALKDLKNASLFKNCGLKENTKHKPLGSGYQSEKG